ncbi:Detected protein of unknown function [Hibiscus syriacus]|uniref:Reverse transcriptase domain-containing protein n=1 Tax=Hibiscus syriacus TaxID=106335 RepID=A0A6A2YPK4_HIBSY|nr:Detected protein of unknown function [Hibiscus syriacus]
MSNNEGINFNMSGLGDGSDPLQFLIFQLHRFTVIASLTSDVLSFVVTVQFKVSQIIGKPDLAPVVWVRKLVTLCDQAPTTPFDVVQLVLEKELGRSIGEVFEKLDVNPLGSASIAHVHRARLKGDVEDVVVKVSPVYDDIIARSQRSTTYVRTTVGDTEAFPVEIGLHQGSALSPYIFALIMDDIYCATPDGVPWCMLFADDIVLVAETKSELNSRLATRKTALEDKGLRINIEKTEYLCSNFNGNQNDEDVEVCIEGHVLPSKDCFKYLGSMIHKDGGVDDDVTHRIKAGWLKWRAATGVLCDKKVPLKLKGKFYRMAIRPALLYGSECWAPKKDHVRRIEAAEMRMLRWTCGRTLWDMTTNSAIRMSLGVVSVSEKLREGRLRWFGHVLRRLPSDAVRRVESITVYGARRKGRPRRKWDDCLRSDLMDLGLTEDMTYDRKLWRLKTRVVE